MINIVKDKFDEKIASQIEKYYNFAEVLEQEQSLSLILIQKFVEALSSRTSRIAHIEYDEEALKGIIVDQQRDNLAELCSHSSNIEHLVDVMFDILSQPSVPSLDGVDEMVKDDLNSIYRNPENRMVDKVRYFNSLLSKYEVYLKKMYYLIHNQEVENDDGSKPTLVNVIYAIDPLRRLRNAYNYNSYINDEQRKYAQFLRMVIDWRNDRVHTAPLSSEQEINAAISVVVAMYLYATGILISDLEVADASDGHSDTYYIEGDAPAMAAESE